MLDNNMERFYIWFWLLFFFCFFLNPSTSVVQENTAMLECSGTTNLSPTFNRHEGENIMADCDFLVNLSLSILPSLHI